MASGALASGLGYAIWYAALPHLSRTRAAVVQLSVPVIAGFGAVVFIGEAVTPRLLIASAVILGGIAVAVVLAGRRRSA
jgi:drug/metabolite transporter (DMT)-like permease